MRAIASFLSIMAGLFLATATSLAVAKSPSQDGVTASCKPPTGGEGGPIKYEW